MTTPENIFAGDERLDSTEALLGALSGVLQDVPVGVAVFDRDLRLRRCNRSWGRFVEENSPHPELLAPGVSLFDIIPGLESFALPLGERLMAGEVVTEHNVPIIGRFDVTYWDIVAAPLYENGEVAGFVEVAIDATAREQAYQSLELRVEERTRELEKRQWVADGLHRILSILNSCCPTEQILDFVIGEARSLLGGDAVAVYRVELAEGRLLTVGSRGIPDDLILDIAFPTDEGFVSETILQRKPMVIPDSNMLFRPVLDRLPPDQKERIHRVFTHYRALLVAPVVIGEQVWGGLALYYLEPREFSEEEVALACDLADHLALAIENARLREQAEESAIAEERSRLARDLHDAVTQTLFSASMIAEVLPAIMDRDEEEGHRRLSQLRDLTRGALAEMRSLLLELRPAALADANLGELLHQLAEATSGRSGVTVAATVECDRELPVDDKVALYRIAQEALNNVAKHSGASHADIMLANCTDDLTLTITDDGRGFDAAAVPPERLGLGIMRERAASMGAKIAIDSEPGRGTAVVVSWHRSDEEGCGCS